MSVFDVRTDVEREIVQIVFEDESPDGYRAIHLRQSGDGVGIYDEAGDQVSIQGKEHAKNLIKALGKATALGWLK